MRKIQSYPMCFVLFLSLLQLGCKENKKESELKKEAPNSQQGEQPLAKIVYGEMPDGEKVEQYTLSNAAGMEIDVITYGGIITRWTAPDKNGDYDNIVLGFDNLE